MSQEGSNSFTLNVSEVCNSENIHILNVKWYFTIKDIKDQLYRCTNIPVKYQQLFHDSCPTALRNQMNLHDLGIAQTGHILRLSITSEKENFVLVEASPDVIDSVCSSLLNDVRLGLRRPGLKPLKTDEFDGTGGVYFMRSSTGTNIAVFKPADEEQGMPYNAKNHCGSGDEGLRPNFKPGQGCIREVAAYLLDVDNFCGVPSTTLVRCEHPVFNYHNERTRQKVDPYPKVGSLQQFIWASDTFEDVGSSVLGDFEVQKIALLDLRILNNDRNEANILAILKKNPYTGRGSRSCSITSYDSTSGESGADGDEQSIDFDGEISSGQKDRYKLVPIDHGYCLPTSLCISQWDWAWFNKPHVKRPLHPTIKEYLLKIDIEECIRKLQVHVAAQANVLIPEESLFLVRVMHKLLVDSIQKGLTLHDIASIVARNDEEVPSTLERLISEAEDNAHRYLESHSSLLFKKNTSLTINTDTKSSPKEEQKTLSDSKLQASDKNDNHNHNDNHNQEVTTIVPKFRRMTSLSHYDVPTSPWAESLSLRMATSVSPKESKERSSPKLILPLKSRSPAMFLQSSSSDETSESSSGRESDNIDDEDADVAVVTPHSLAKLDLSPCPGHCVGGHAQSIVKKNNFKVKQPFDFSVTHVTQTSSNSSSNSNSGRSTKTTEQNRRREMSSSSSSENRNHLTEFVQPKDNLLFDTFSASVSSPSSPSLGNSYSNNSNSRSNSGSSSSSSQLRTSPIDSALTKWNHDFKSGTPPPLVQMTRSTSFQGFNSAPIYETSAERRLSKTVPEKRKQVAVTKEFRDLRYSFTKKACKSMISKTVKLKQENK